MEREKEREIRYSRSGVTRHLNVLNYNVTFPLLQFYVFLKSLKWMADKFRVLLKIKKFQLNLKTSHNREYFMAQTELMGINAWLSVTEEACDGAIEPQQEEITFQNFMTRLNKMKERKFGPSSTFKCHKIFN